ncbi:MAG: tetratricopeptide repeat protein [Desulfobacterales bacterium]|nr:tetratricopeptide repeat protein [Desulfobacterales bacterium]
MLVIDYVWAKERDAFALIQKERSTACEELKTEYPEDQVKMEQARIKIIVESKFDEGLDILHYLFIKVKEEENPLLFADILLYQGVANNYKGNNKVAVEKLEAAKLILKEEEKKLEFPDDPENLKTLQIIHSLGRTYANLGYTNITSYHLTEAISAYRESLRYLKLGGLTTIRAACQNDLGYLYARMGKFDLARILCKEGLKIREEHLLDYFIGLSYNTLGQIELLNDNPHVGADHCKKSLTIFKRIGDYRGIGLASRLLGGNLTAIGKKMASIDKVKEAEEYLRDAKRIFKDKEKNPEPMYLSEIYIFIGFMYQEWGNLLKESDKDVADNYFKRSEENFLLSIDQWEKTGSDWCVAYTLERLFWLYFFHMNNHKKASEI